MLGCRPCTQGWCPNMTESIHLASMQHKRWFAFAFTCFQSIKASLPQLQMLTHCLMCCPCWGQWEWTVTHDLSSTAPTCLGPIPLMKGHYPRLCHVYVQLYTSTMTERVHYHQITKSFKDLRSEMQLLLWAPWTVMHQNMSLPIRSHWAFIYLRMWLCLWRCLSPLSKMRSQPLDCCALRVLTFGFDSEVGMADWTIWFGLIVFSQICVQPNLFLWPFIWVIFVRERLRYPTTVYGNFALDKWHTVIHKNCKRGNPQWNTVPVTLNSFGERGCCNLVPQIWLSGKGNVTNFVLH